MKNKMKQLFGILLSLVLALGLMPGTSMTTYAEANLPTIAISPEGAGTVTTGTAGSGSFMMYTFSATPADGYRFVQWTGSKSNGSVNTFTNNPWKILKDNFDSTSAYGYYTEVTAVFEAIIPVSSISLDQSAVSLSVGGTETLTATVSPDDASDKSVTWSSSDTAVATVENGVVTAVAEGTATITVTATNGTDDTSDDKTATCTVTVTSAAAPISYTVTFKVANGAWDDETTADKIVTLTGNEGDTLKLSADQIPAVGTKPNDGYKAGSWDVTPSTDTAISSNVTYTYTYVADSSGGSSDSGNSGSSDSGNGGSSDSGSTSGGSSDSGSGSSSSGSSDNTNTNTDTSAKVPYDDVPISTGSVNDITGTASATAESNPFGTKIENSSNLTTLLSLTDAEVAQGVNVWLDIQDMSASVPQADKTLIQNTSGDYTVGLYLDINLFKKVGSNDATKVTETNGKVKASIVIPESLWKSGRTFEIIRVHDSVATTIAGTYDENTHVFTFETDKFSTYALAYKDPASSSDSTSTSDSNSSNSSNSTESTAPKTGDPNDIRVWYLLLIASLGGLGFLGYSKKKKVND